MNNIVTKFLGEDISSNELHEMKWLGMLFNTNEHNVNIERLHSVENFTPNPTLRYVERTLQYLETEEELFNSLSDFSKTALLETLQWSEVAKCGSDLQRSEWIKKGYNLDVHNEASAQIYLDNIATLETLNKFVCTLIYTHGLFGMYLRGEVNLSENLPILGLIKSNIIPDEEMYNLLLLLNGAIISAVSSDLWVRTLPKLENILRNLCFRKQLVPEFTVLERLRLLFPSTYAEVKELTDEEKNIFERIFKNHSLWYPTVALDNFSREEILKIFSVILTNISDETKNISFYGFSKNMYYDYDGVKKMNVYKKRIVEDLLKESTEVLLSNSSTEHVVFEITHNPEAICFNVKFTKVCEALINFLVEAERSGLMEYKKNIAPILDLFGLRRDIFDRLSNEDSYLDTMNSIDCSRKSELLDYVNGNMIVDVGSGGGILLDRLEERFPEKTIIGTDISTNVIEVLQNKIADEGHTYNIEKHNFVEEPLEYKVDTIIFSSILHEVYSYTEFEGKRFNIDSVKTALKNAISSLNPGGRILIRDGVLSPEIGTQRIRLRNPSDMKFLNNYLTDFKGLTNLRDDKEIFKDEFCTIEPGNILKADINLIREFLYTFTWGEDSYSCEVNEQFGYFHISEFADFMKSLGLRVLVSESYLEPGYPDNLDKKVELLDGLNWTDMPSNMILVVEKI